MDIKPRANCQPICSGCGKKRRGYDNLVARRLKLVALWIMAVFFVHAMRRFKRPTRGIVVERVPWAEGKRQLTTSYRLFLARWAKRLSWMDTEVAFNKKGSSGNFVARTGRFRGFGAVECRDGHTLHALCPATGPR